MPQLRALLATLRQPSMQIALIVACANFMQNLDSTIIVTALPAMAHSFATNAARVSEGITAYALAAAVCIPASAWLAERLGTRNLFAGAIVVFTLASMACGLSGTFAAFIAARLAQGSSAAMMSPVGRLIVLRNTEKHELMQTLSTLVWPSLLAPVIGPALGGFITGLLSWRWIFYVNLPIGIIAVALVLSVIPNHRAEEHTAFDSRGFILLALTVGCLTYGLDLVALQHPNVPLALTLLVCAAASGIAAARHLSAAKNPLVQLSVLLRRAFFIASVSGGGVSRAAISATPFLLPLMLELGFGYTPIDAGLLLLIYMLANLLMKSITNPIIRRFGLRQVLVVNGAIVAAGVGACALIAPGLPMVLTALILLFAGASRSMQFTAMLFTTFADISQDERAPASVLFSLTQQVAVAVGVAAAALILNFSRLLRHATTLAPFDFRLSFALMGGLGLLAVFAYTRLDAHTGSEVSGHRVSAG